jgi:tetratricopeptide (TPR) repeat protein
LVFFSDQRTIQFCSRARPEPPASTTRGIQLYEQGDLQGAAKVLEEVVAKRPDDADAWYYLDLARYREGWIGAALSPFERVVELRQILPTHAPSSLTR